MSVLGRKRGGLDCIGLDWIRGSIRGAGRGRSVLWSEGKVAKQYRVWQKTNERALNQKQSKRSRKKPETEGSEG